MYDHRVLEINEQPEIESSIDRGVGQYKACQHDEARKTFGQIKEKYGEDYPLLQFWMASLCSENTAIGQDERENRIDEYFNKIQAVAMKKEEPYHSVAMHALGCMYETKLGKAPKDLYSRSQEAIDKEQEDTYYSDPCQLMAALMYLDAAEKAYVRAQHALGYLYGNPGLIQQFKVGTVEELRDQIRLFYDESLCTKHRDLNSKMRDLRLSAQETDGEDMDVDMQVGTTSANPAQFACGTLDSQNENEMLNQSLTHNTHSLAPVNNLVPSSSISSNTGVELDPDIVLMFISSKTNSLKRGLTGQGESIAQSEQSNDTSRASSISKKGKEKYEESDNVNMELFPNYIAQSEYWYAKAARQGDVGAQLKLVELYSNTKGGFYRPFDAKYLCEQLANQGYPVAQNKLGEMLRDGLCGTKDIKHANELFLKAANQRNVNAQINLGSAYWNGRGVERDYKTAVRYYRLAADQGNLYAQLKLGNAYWNGRGVERDYKTAVRYYRLAADQGNLYAQLKLGDAYWNGRGVERDYTRAVYYYKSAAKQGNAEGQLKLGNAYYCGHGVSRDCTHAMRYYRLAAEQGNVYAQTKLGDAYWNGLGVFQDRARAVYYYKLAAEQGNVNALARLGDAYWNGLGVEQNYTRAVYYYELAAKQDNVYAYLKLGDAYLSGLGVSSEEYRFTSFSALQGSSSDPYSAMQRGMIYIHNRDRLYIFLKGDVAEQSQVQKIDIPDLADLSNLPMSLSETELESRGLGLNQGHIQLLHNVQAMYYFKLAAEQGNVYAQTKLGDAYLQGLGVVANQQQAVEYYRRAAAQEDEGAKVKLSQLADQNNNAALIAGLQQTTFAEKEVSVAPGSVSSNTVNNR